MQRKYSAKMFLFFVLTNFLFHFIYLFIPGIILCIIGIWVKSCLWIGLAILGLDLILSIIEQIHIRKTVETPSDNPAFNELMDALCSTGGLEAFRKVLDEKAKSSDHIEHQEEN